jgi:predicted DNA-binding transcriptional regulator YafY
MAAATFAARGLARFKGTTMHVSAHSVLRRVQVIDAEPRRSSFPNAPKLARVPEVVPGTIQRDIDFMRCQLRAPIAFDSHHDGFYYTDASYRLSYFQATQGELVALLVASQVMTQYHGTPFEHDLRQALEKIVELLPDKVEIPLESLRAPPRGIDPVIA